MSNTTTIAKGQANLISEREINTSTRMELAGTSEAFDLVLNFKSTADEKTQVALSAMTLEIFNAYQEIARGYYKLLGVVSKCMKTESWKELEGIKSFNDYLIKVTGCSKATASELKLVASRFYDEKGELLRGYDCFTYSELILLAKCENKEAVAKVALEVSKMKKHTRKDVMKLLASAKLDGIGYDDLYLIADKKKSTVEQDGENASESEQDGENASESAQGFTDAYTKTQLLADLHKIAKHSISKHEVQELAHKIIKAVEDGNITIA